MDIQMALALIEEYVESLHVWELNNEYNKAIESMFDWLKEYECDGERIAEACQTIEEYTGYHPERIRTLEDVAIVKQALYGAYNSECLGRRRVPNNPIDRVLWALANVRFGFGGGDDPDDYYQD
jgi:hypothetical protein